MSSIKSEIGSVQSLTTTGLNSLGNGSSYQLAAIDNTSLKYTNILVQIALTANAAGVTANTGAVTVWASVSLDGTTFVEGATASAGSFTFANPTNLIQVGTLSMTANGQVAGLLIDLAQAFRGTVPCGKISLIFTNSSGAAFAASGHTVNWQGYYGTVA